MMDINTTHRCSDRECGYFGQPTDRGCLCHKPERTMLEEAAQDLLEALNEAHRALMFYEWYNNPKSGWASSENVTVRGMVDAAIAKATGA